MTPLLKGSWALPRLAFGTLSVCSVGDRVAGRPGHCPCGNYTVEDMDSDKYKEIRQIIISSGLGLT